MRRTRFNLLSPTLFALMVLEILYLAGAVHFAGLFSTVGADFRAPYAAARIAREEGFPHIYDLERHMPIQRALCRVAGSEAQCVLIPMVFLPVFLLPIPPLTFLSPVPAFVLWSGLNLFGTLPVLHPWLRSLPLPSRRQVLLLALLSFPVFSNLLWGQSNLWLMLCGSLFLREWAQGRQSGPVSGRAVSCSNPRRWSCWLLRWFWRGSGGFWLAWERGSPFWGLCHSSWTAPGWPPGLGF